MSHANRLLLVRVKDTTSTLLNDLKLSQFAEGEPLNVSPCAWNEEAGLSHYGYCLAELKLKDIQEVKKVEEANPGLTIIDLPADDYTDDDVAKALNSVGLRINTLV